MRSQGDVELRHLPVFGERIKKETRSLGDGELRHLLVFRERIEKEMEGGELKTI